MATRQGNCPNPGLNFHADVFTRGVIPTKLSELENDVPYLALDALYEILGVSGSGEDTPMLITMISALTGAQLTEFKSILGTITDIELEAVATADIPW